MKKVNVLKRISLSLIMLLLIFMIACKFSCKDDGWKEYYTPELFLSNSMDYHNVTVKSSNIEGGVQDKELIIKDYILEVGSFESIKKNETKSSRFITYHILISNATTGPNYSNMIIYDDGFIEIEYKASLGKHHYFYYSFDSSMASTLFDKIENQIRENQKLVEE